MAANIVCRRLFSNLVLKSNYRSVRALATEIQFRNENVELYLFDTLSGFQNCLQLESSTKLATIYQHYLNSTGKFFRPLLVGGVSMCCNSESHINSSQQKLAFITEMIHTASLIHDDIVDNADIRRKSPTTNLVFGNIGSVFAGNLLMSRASIELARLNNAVVIKILSQVIEDLVTGELMQLGLKKTADERINHYLTKTFKKTASLMAYSCQAASVLSNDVKEGQTDACFEFGRNVGLAFQLADDLRDFISSTQTDKPVNADLTMGLATAPVLFAALQHSELNTLIMRRFTHPEDVLRAREMVLNSSGIEDTRQLINNHIHSAQMSLNFFADSEARGYLLGLVGTIVKRL